MMFGLSNVALWVLLVSNALAVKVKVVMHSEQDDSIYEDDDTQATESWKRKETVTPIKHNHNLYGESEIDEPKTEKPRPQNPNDLIFDLIYHQNHVNSMFKYGNSWYTWTTETRNDGSKAINYYVCFAETKHCDDVGWERTDNAPRCAIQIEKLLPEDRACIYYIGVAPPPRSGGCEKGERIKVADLMHGCGPRLKTTWRFMRVNRRSSNNAIKSADVNSLICEDEDECFVNMEYRIHHDRITMSLHEPSRGHTFKNVIKRIYEEDKSTMQPLAHIHRKAKIINQDSKTSKTRKHYKPRPKTVEGKGTIKQKYDEYRTVPKNNLKGMEDLSEDVSD